MYQLQRACPRRPLVELRHPPHYLHRKVVHLIHPGRGVEGYDSIPCNNGLVWEKDPRDTFPAPYRKTTPSHRTPSAQSCLGNPCPGVNEHALSAWCKGLILVTKMTAEPRRCLRSSIQRICWGLQRVNWHTINRELCTPHHEQHWPQRFRRTYVVCDVLLRKRTNHAKDAHDEIQTQHDTYTDNSSIAT